MALKFADILVVQPGGEQGDNPSPPKKCTVETLFGLTPAQSLQTVLTAGNTSAGIDIKFTASAEESTPTIQLAASGLISTTTNISAGSGDEQILLTGSTGAISGVSVSCSGSINGATVVAGSGDNSISLNGTTGQLGSDDDSTSIKGGVYA